MLAFAGRIYSLMMNALPQNDVTQLLQAWGSGDHSALDRLTPLVHDELRRLARRRMSGENREHTLETSALVNEAYLRLVDVKNVQWQNRAHFFAIAAKIMRRILIDFARARLTEKRGGGKEPVVLDEAQVSFDRSAELLALDEALEALAQTSPRKGRVVELRFFGGLPIEEIARMLDVSPSTVALDWRFAKSWLYQEIRNNKS